LRREDLFKMADYYGRRCFFKIITSGHRVHASSHTSKLSPVGKGPHKSICMYVCMSCQGLSGMAMDLRGSGVACGAIYGNGKHDLIIDSISRSIPGNHMFSRTI
jgi:hypothetical protein